MQSINNKKLTGERALYSIEDTTIDSCVFEEGESPLKHAHNVNINNTLFRYKYPVWHSDHIEIKDSVIFENGRAGIWYTNNLKVSNTLIEAPKIFRRCNNVELTDVSFSNAMETLWNCNNIKLNNVQAKGDYLAMNTNNIYINNLSLIGNYPFDGCENIEIHNSKLISKDAFWNCKNVTVYDSFISGEYLAWNSENVTFINCTIESNQGLCYIKSLKMVNCKTLHTDLCFEYSDCDVEVMGHIESVKNPNSGKIKCSSIGTLILNPERIDPSKTIIDCPSIEHQVSSSDNETLTSII